MSNDAGDTPLPDSTGEIRARAVVPYLPGLDGLRAIAVISVIFYHANHAWLKGGFLGVEVFFVISGYLITLLLVAESTRTGRISLRDFWLRRARRLLPALWTLLVGVTTYVALFRRSELGNLRGDVVAGFTYVTNWFQIRTGSSYFSAFAYAPLRHLWSLAVEEQFYLLWPLLMFAVLRLGRKRLPAVGFVFFLSSVGIALVCAWVYKAGPIADIAETPSQYVSFLGRDVSRIDFAYLSTITRMGGLFIGAALGIWWRPWSVARARIGQRGALLDTVGLVGLAGLGFMFWRFQNVVAGTDVGSRGYDLLYRGGFFLVGLATVAVIAAVTHPTAVLGRVVLGNKLFVWVGQRSYGLYLYHWAIFQFSRKLAGNALTWPQFVGLMAITVVVTELSYRVIETPVRKGAFSRWVRSWRGAPTPERRRHRRNMVAVAVVVGAFPVFAVANLSTAKLKLDDITQSLVNAQDATTNLLGSTTVPTANASTTSSIANVVPTTTPVAKIDVLAIGDSVMLGAAPRDGEVRHHRRCKEEPTVPCCSRDHQLREGDRRARRRSHHPSRYQQRHQGRDDGRDFRRVVRGQEGSRAHQRRSRPRLGRGQQHPHPGTARQVPERLGTRLETPRRPSSRMGLRRRHPPASEGPGGLHRGHHEGPRAPARARHARDHDNHLDGAIDQRRALHDDWGVGQRATYAWRL